MGIFLHDLFLGILNMSITGSYVILFVIIVRQALKKVPKIFSYGLWSVVLFRLLVPFSFSSALSFLGFFPSRPGKLEAISDNTGASALPEAAPVEMINGNSPTAAPLPSPPSSAADSAFGFLQNMIPPLSVIWLLGAAALLCYGVVTYWRLKQRIGTGIRLENNVYQCELIDSPCVVGIIRPKIYLPYGLSQSEKTYILKHEQIHIKRFDHLLKLLAFLTLCIHWFNPLVWISFLLMSRDMEMSCDESVLRSLGSDIKKDYSSSLLSFAAGKTLFSASPLTFGEGNAERRICNILNYRRPPMWIAVVTLLLLAFVGIGLLSNPADSQEPAEQNNNQQFTNQEIRSIAEIWAEALKTRDGEPRYQMMSEEMKTKFISEQKKRSDPWNFNIGVSSPWVTDYEITVGEASAEILYHTTDSSQVKYDKKEIIYFGKVNGKTVVTKSEELISDWTRVYYYAPSAKSAMQVYTKALLESDYSTILSLTHSAKLDPYGQLIWDTVKISDVKVVSEDVRDGKACYELALTVEDGGTSAFEKGVSPRWLWLVKGAHGWYAEGLMTGGVPDSDWWNDTASAGPFFGTSEWAAGTYEFDRLIYLSPLSSSTFDYAEGQMKGTKFTIGDELFEINRPGDEDFSLTKPGYGKEMMTEEMVRAFEKSTFNTVSISEYKEKYRYTIYSEDGRKTNYYLFVMDGQLWLSSYADNTADKSEITMYLWKLK